MYAAQWSSRSRIRLAVGGWPCCACSTFGTKVCLLAVAKAAERNPEITRAFVEDGHESVSHGYRWLDYQTIPEESSAEHVRLGIETIERVAGAAGRLDDGPAERQHAASSPRTRGFLYDRDSLTTNCPIGLQSAACAT